MLGLRHRQLSLSTARWLAGCGLLLLGLPSCQDSQEVALRELVGRGFEFSVEDYHRVASAGELEVLRLYHRAGMSPLVNAPDGLEALHQATTAGKSEIVRELLRTGVDPDSPTPQAETPAILAAAAGDAATLNILIAQGADLHLRNGEGWTALTLAASAGHAEATAILAPHCPKLLDSALHLASRSGDGSTIDALLSAGADVNAVAAGGRTPLMQAAQAGKDTATSILITAGANPLARDEEGQTASDLARNKGWPETALHLDTPPPPKAHPIKWKGNGLGSKITTAFEQAGAPNQRSLEYAASTAHEERPLRLNGIHFATPLFGGHLTFQMLDLQESQLPLELVAVDSSSGIAQVRLLGSAETIRTISLGQEIPETGLRLSAIDKRIIYPQGREAPPLDASRITVESIADGTDHLVAKGFSASTSISYARLQIGDGELLNYDARLGDEFTAGAAETSYRVARIRPDHLLLENLAKGTEIKIPRETRVAGF